jgi:hypothetical protein
MDDEKEEVLSVEVDCSQSLHWMISRGKYDRVSAEINPRNFRLTRRGLERTNIVLIQFERYVAPVEIVFLMRKRGLRPATLDELLAIGSQHPELQRARPIAALGSAHVVRNRRYVPCLTGSESERELALAVVYKRWSVYYGFAFVPQQQAIH